MIFQKKELEQPSYVTRYKTVTTIDDQDRNVSDIKKSQKVASEKNLSRLQSKNRPATLQYFDAVLKNREQRAEELMRFKAGGGKVVGVFCIHVPDELIYAAGAVPVKMSCGFYDTISLGEEIAPKNLCPLIKSSIGTIAFKLDPIFNLCDVIIVPTSCDGKKKMIDLLSNYVTVWPLELPNNKESTKGKELWAEEVYNLRAKLEKLTGKTISTSALKQSIELLQKRSYLTRNLLELRKNQDPIITGRDMAIVINSAFIDDLHRWMTNLEKLIEEIKTKPAQPKKAHKRILLLGSPLIFPNMKILNVIEELGAVVVADDSCASSQYFYNPAIVNEWTNKAMMNAIIDKHLLPAICPIFVNNDDRIDRVLELAAQYKVDGAIYHVLRLCNVFDFEYKKVSTVFDQNKIPILRLETEYSEEDTEQIKTRVEAFLELLDSVKK
jgi:benzoyl-CoA reductase/2-hydroxyglutaryl-CoA dehydratase subunit BcrC/BadD/HgdB